MYTDIGKIDKTMDEVNDYIADSILSKDYSVGEYLTTDDIISYGGYYQDAENDPIYEQQWEYEYDPSVFGEAAGEVEHIVRTESEPITTFTDTGAYAIRLNVRDNPVGDDDAFDSYRLWSGTEEYEKLVVVQSRPVASVHVEVSEKSKDKDHCMVNTTYDAYDPDHPSDKTKGIREEYFAYKNVNDAEWTEGKMPNSINVGETYLVKYQVKDIEGIWSFPSVAVVKTNDLLKYQEVEDNMPPEIYLTSSRPEANVGEELTIEGYAIDDHGTETFTVYVDGKKALDAFGRVIYMPKKAGTIVVKAEAVDIGGNKSEKEITIPVVDNRDMIPPTTEITSPTSGSELDFNVQIKGTAKDETKLSGYTLSYKEEKADSYKVFAKNNSPVSDDILGTLDISDFESGAYEILLTAEDEAGNKSYSSIILYIERGVTEGYSLTAEITDIRYNAETDSVDIYGTVLGDGHMSGYTLTYKTEGSEDKIKVLEGTDEVTEGLLGSIKAEGLSTGTYDLMLTVNDTEGNSETADGGFEYTKGESGNTTIEKTEDGNDNGNGGNSETPGTQETVKKQFGVALSYSTANIGTEVKVQVTIPDNVKEEAVKIMKGEELLSEGTRRASFTSDKSGKVTITATAVADEGEEVKASANCTFYNLADKNPPTAAITSPTIDTVLTEPVDFVGSAYDKEDLESWKLEYRMAGEKDYILLNEGTEPVKDGVLGHLDTTMLMNGQYNVKLTVKDQGGNVRRLENDYVVEGELKVGAMHIGFTKGSTCHCELLFTVAGNNVINNILNTLQTLHLQGLMSGAVNVAMHNMLGYEGMNLINSFYEGLLI